MGLYGVFKPADAGTVVARAGAATQPVASAAGRLGNGRVRVELNSASRATPASKATAAAPASPVAATAASLLTPVLFTQPLARVEARADASAPAE